MAPSGSVNGPHSGAAAFPGASLQIGLALTYTGTSAQTQSIPVSLPITHEVPEPSIAASLIAIVAAAGGFMVYKRKTHEIL